MEKKKPADESKKKVTRKKKTDLANGKPETEARKIRVSRNKDKAKEQLEKKEITATQYFKVLKRQKTKADEETLKKYKETSEQLLKLFTVSGQVTASTEMKEKIEMIEKELNAVMAGYQYFMYKKDIMEFINSVMNDRVKIINLASYDRIIPFDVMIQIENLKKIFDELYILYTDYTIEKEEKVKKERKEKDPILLGAFIDVTNNPSKKKSGHIYEKMFFIADWVDEFCDLTVSKLVEEVSKSGKKIKIYKDILPSSEEMKNVEKLYSMIQNDEMSEDSVHELILNSNTVTIMNTGE